ncbi:MAG: electron transport complex subunit RsxC [Gammaproteobacteria bacterium]|nr:electron transport complex subunit RsxC [Gammaproteobacteria bacterium]
MKPLRKLFKIRGGVHPDDHKGRTAQSSIEDMPMPALLHIPLQQHIGSPASPMVKRGDRVLKGQLLAHSQGMISAPVHAPTSGRIVGVGNYPAHHPSGLSVHTITLQPDGADRWIEGEAPPTDPFALEPEEIATRVAAAGIVGMGGATFPSAVKLNLRSRYCLETLVINGAECEPYLTCDDRLMREESAAVIDGIRIMAYALGVKRVIIGIENNKPEAQAAMQAAAEAFPEIEIARLPARYPMGSEKHLVQTVTGVETPARGLTADIGVVVHNVATAYAVHDALRFGRPLISRVVTISGGAIRLPKNLRVLIGTPIEELITHCGGYSETPERLISGGPMMGQPLPGTRVPIIKGSNGVLALTVRETKAEEAMPCIRCASCVKACPCGLVPLEMANYIRSGDLEGAVAYGLMDCISCGSCAFVCPSNIRLVQFFNYAKGELTARQRAEHTQNETRRLAEARTIRLERQKQAKREAMARRKQAQEAAKQAKQAAEARAQQAARTGS